MIPAPRLPAEATAADREAARQLLSDFACVDVGDGLHVSRLARLFAQQRADGHAAGIAEATT